MGSDYKVADAHADQQQLLLAQQQALAEVTSIPRNEAGPVFAEPWQAQAFAMTLHLHASGVFAWTEWADELHRQIAHAQADGDPDLGDTYYHHWLAALEALVIRKGLTSERGLKQLYENWQQAALHTPHGEPITLDSCQS